MHNAPSALVIVVDRLGAGYLPPYGSTWVETPALNRFASQSLVCEHAIVDAPSLQAVYGSYWSGVHALRAAHGDDRSLPGLLAERKLHTALLTDDAQLAEHPLAASFAECIALPAADVDASAEVVEQTRFAQLVAAALDWLEQQSAPFLLWLHFRGMQGGWDAPLVFRNELAEDDDPPPPTFVAPPDYALRDDFDPDEVLGLVHAYAGQVAAIDICLGALFEEIESRRGKNMLTALTAPRGYPLGEHQRVGASGDGLYGEVLQVPWMLHLPHQSKEGIRSQAIVQPPDLWATLLDWFGALPEKGDFWGRSLLPLADGAPLEAFDRAVSVSGGARSLRTPAWFFRSLPDGQQSLYRKPDDRWEVNEIGDRCPSIVEQMETALAQFQHAADAAERDLLPPLSEELIEGID